MIPANIDQKDDARYHPPDQYRLVPFIDSEFKNRFFSPVIIYPYSLSNFSYCVRLLQTMVLSCAQQFCSEVFIGSVFVIYGKTVEPVRPGNIHRRVFF